MPKKTKYRKMMKGKYNKILQYATDFIQFFIQKVKKGIQIESLFLKLVLTK